ncbi:hypothetical protein [Specibacter sp. RAF43]|uniref:hypothetical protein n=1 Tax=Specibacter sp. RAF43 TaxID=3233057 RepID=UPI003F9920F2
MTENLPAGGFRPSAEPPPSVYPPAAYAPPAAANLTSAPPARWPAWFGGSAAAGIVLGLLWWFAAPGGAWYGKGPDFSIWPPRDLTLAGLCVLAGVAAGILVGRSATQAGAGRRFVAVVAGGLLGSVIAWRTGIFAGDLFATRPDNLPNPSMVFSLRAASTLLLWPLAAACATFFHAFLSHLFAPARTE